MYEALKQNKTDLTLQGLPAITMGGAMNLRLEIISDHPSSGISSGQSSGSVTPRKMNAPHKLGHARQPSFKNSESNDDDQRQQQQSRFNQPVNVTSRIGWLASLDIDDQPTSFRKTGIICTIGMVIF